MLVFLCAAAVVKSLSIILVRDIDGKTFVNALNDVIAAQIKKPNAEEESSLSTFQNTFLGRNLKQGTSIYLTWLEPSRMLVSHNQFRESSLKYKIKFHKLFRTTRSTGRGPRAACSRVHEPVIQGWQGSQGARLDQGPLCQGWVRGVESNYSRLSPMLSPGE